jgi:indoleamine 2,3-dioxygenase
MEHFRRRGFLPPADPLTQFPPGSPYAVIDTIGDELPQRLEQPEFRRWARSLEIPPWRDAPGDRRAPPEDLLAPFQQADAGSSTDLLGVLAQARLYYVRIGFLASGYVNQIGQPPVQTLPANLAVPLCRICQVLDRPPILSYAGYALYNWTRLDPSGPIALGNIDTFQNFVTLYDEHWFILVHVDIEARAAALLDAVLGLAEADAWQDRQRVDAAIERMTETIVNQTGVLRRIPEHMSADLYFRTFRPYIRFFDDVVYEGVDRAPFCFRGETGAQSSVMPLLDSFFKIPHEPNVLTRHLIDMRRYMPASHRALLEQVQAYPDVRATATAEVFNRALEAIAEFRSVHYGWARQYISEKDPDPLGTGGTPYVRWLEQLREETLAHRVR